MGQRVPRWVGVVSALILASNVIGHVANAFLIARIASHAGTAATSRVNDMLTLGARLSLLPWWAVGAAVACLVVWSLGRNTGDRPRLMLRTDAEGRALLLENTGDVSAVNARVLRLRVKGKSWTPLTIASIAPGQTVEVRARLKLADGREWFDQRLGPELTDALYELDVLAGRDAWMINDGGIAERRLKVKYFDHTGRSFNDKFVVRVLWAARIYREILMYWYGPRATLLALQRWCRAAKGWWDWKTTQG